MYRYLQKCLYRGLCPKLSTNKHDVLLQILQLGIIDVDYKVSDEMAFAFYLQNNFCTVAESLFSMLSSVGFVNQTNQSLFGVFLVIKWLKSLKDKVNEFKKEVDQTVYWMIT